jgi:transcriptional regulator with XRE-family HTH domain
MRIGLNIKTIRLLKNLTQEAVAKELGLSVTAYGDIERSCTDNITIKRLEQVAQTFNVPVEQLIRDPDGALRSDYHTLARLDENAVREYKLALQQKDNEINSLKQQLKKAENELIKLRNRF